MTEHEVVVKDLNERLDRALKARDEWKNATHATQLELDKANAKLERRHEILEDAGLF